MEHTMANTSTKISRLERELEQTQELLLEKYIQLGKSIYEVADRNVDEINSLTDKLIHLKRVLSANCDEVECGECLAMNSKENLYCKRCGAKLPPQKEEELK